MKFEYVEINKMVNDNQIKLLSDNSLKLFQHRQDQIQNKNNKETKPCFYEIDHLWQHAWYNKNAILS